MIGIWMSLSMRMRTQTLERKLAALNLNITRKWRLRILKVIELSRPILSVKKKRFIISMGLPAFLDQIFAC